MPLRKKNKYKSKIIFWAAVGAVVFLMLYVPKRPDTEAAPAIEYELY